MNNDQNNSIFGIPNQMPATTPETNPTPVEQTIPGANVTPVTNQPTQPINNITAEASNVAPINTNPVVTDAPPATPVEPVAEPVAQINTNQELKIDTPSPFDIGIGPVNDTVNTGVPTPMMTTDNIVNTPAETPTPINNIAPPTNNSGDAAPLTNTSNNTESNDNIVSVKKYLGHIVLFSLPVIGFIMLLVKAFGDKKDKNISNLAKAQLLLSVIVAAPIIIIAIIAFAIGGFAKNATEDYIMDSWDEMANTTNQDYNYDYSTDDDYNTDYDYSDATDYNTDADNNTDNTIDANSDNITDDYNLDY